MTCQVTLAKLQLKRRTRKLEQKWYQEARGNKRDGSGNESARQGGRTVKSTGHRGAGFKSDSLCGCLPGWRGQGLLVWKVKERRVNRSKKQR